MTDYDGELLSYGGGVNTVAMLLRLVNEGWRGPIVFADTGGEHPETYCHLTMMEAWCAERGLTIERVSFATLTPEEGRDAARLAHWSAMWPDTPSTLEQNCLTRKIIPVLVARWCSVIFKRSVIDAWANSRKYTERLVGIGADETQRAHCIPGFSYPLVDWGWTRPECLRYIKAQGIPMPRKSGCFYCPSQKRSEWRELLDLHPDLYERAAAMERNAHRPGKRAILSNTNRWTLDELKDQFEAQTIMEFDEEVPRVYEPCICHI